MNKLRTILITSERQADTIIRKSTVEANGWSAKWDGWNILVFTPSPWAFYEKRGSFDRDTGQWGYTYTFTPNHKGQWAIRVPRQFERVA